MAAPRDPARAMEFEGLGAPFERNATYDDLDTLPDTWVGEIDPVHDTLEVPALDGATYRVVATAGEDELGRSAPCERLERQLAQRWRR